MKDNVKKIPRRAAPRQVGRMVETVIGCKWSLTVLDLVERGLIRILDLAFIAKGDDGTVAGLEISDLGDNVAELKVFEGASSGLLSDDDISEPVGLDHRDVDAVERGAAHQPDRAPNRQAERGGEWPGGECCVR